MISVFARAENCAIAHDEKNLGYAICGLLLLFAKDASSIPCHLLLLASFARMPFRGLCDLAMMLLLTLLDHFAMRFAS